MTWCKCTVTVTLYTINSSDPVWVGRYLAMAWWPRWKSLLKLLLFCNPALTITNITRGRVVIIHFSIAQVYFFPLIEYHCTFSISYKIPQYYVYYYNENWIIVFWLGRPSWLLFFVPALLLAVPSRVFGKTLVHEFPITNSHTEWYLLFSRGEIVLALAEASPIRN